MHQLLNELPAILDTVVFSLAMLMPLGLLQGWRVGIESHKVASYSSV